MPYKSTRADSSRRSAPVTHLVDSSVLSAMRFDPETQELTLSFRDDRGTYRYSGVPPEVWSAFLAAPSKGIFLNQVLKPMNLPFRRVGRG